MSESLGRAWIDGQIVPLSEARVSVSDRGFLFADSVFETVRTYGRRPFLLGDHLDRLRRSADSLLLPVPWTDAELAAITTQLLNGWSLKREAVVRIMVTRGDGGHGIALPEPQVPRLVVLCRPLPALSRELYDQGVKVVLPSGTRSKDHAVPADVKSGSYLANVLALAEARSRGGFEALFMGADGSISEASTSNLFVVHKGAVWTPGVGDHILPGITRALVLELARSRNIEVREEPISLQQLLAADEVFLTSSLKEILPVRAVGRNLIGAGRPGPQTRWLMSVFASKAAELSAGGVMRLAEAPPH